MKKFRTIAVISALALTMVACGGKDKPTKVTPGFVKESAKETIKESVKETIEESVKETIEETGKETTETEKEVGKETKQEANKGTETKPSTLAKPSKPSNPTPSNPTPSKPSKPSKPAPSKPTPSKPSKPNQPNKPTTPSKPSQPSKPEPKKEKVWVVDVPAKDAVYKTERVLVSPAKDAVYEDKEVVVTPEQQKEEVRGRYVLVPSKGEPYDFSFNTLAEKKQAYQNLLAKEEELLDNWVTSRYYQDFQTYYVTIPAVTKTERVKVSDAQDAVYETKKVLVSPAVKEKGHWEWR